MRYAATNHGNRMTFYHMKITVLAIICHWGLLCATAHGAPHMENARDAGIEVIPFGEGGQLKMIYDRRQRPQAIYMNDQVYMVYNGGANLPESNGKKTFPFVVSYDPQSGVLGEPIRLGNEPDGDQHYCPIIWGDKEQFLHILYGCHRTPGTHLLSRKKAQIGSSQDDWRISTMINESMSYPSIFHISGDRQLIYFRTGEHRSSWSYVISRDNGKTWQLAPTPVTDLNRGDELNTEKDHAEMDEMSSYQTVLPSADGKYLHIVFCSYDDNKKNLPQKMYNPRYGTTRNFSFKYNLYYVKLNLQTHEVVNFSGKQIPTPIDYATALKDCLVWDTEWRGAGVPPDIILDENGKPAFLHVLSADTPTTYNYWYVRHVDGEWKSTRIAPSSDDWNSCYLRREDDGTLYACLVMGEPFFMGRDAEKSNDMDSRGGGDIEEWISRDGGNTWSMNRDLTPRAAEFAGWKFNNIQPIKDRHMKVIPGMYLFYGWPDPSERTAKAFLVVDTK